MTRWRSALVVLVVPTVLALAALASGCGVRVAEDPADEAVEQVLADGHLEVDLRRPPTRDALAMPEGRRTFILQRRDMEPYDVTVTFTDGTTLHTPAHSVSVTSDGEGDPTALVILRHEMTFADLEQVLTHDVEAHDLDEGAVRSFLRSATPTRKPAHISSQTFPAAGVRPERLEVQAISREPAQRHQLNYLISWER